MSQLAESNEEDEGWLTHLSPGVVSQSGISSTNYLHHKRRVETLKASTFILRIEIRDIGG